MNYNFIKYYHDKSGNVKDGKIFDVESANGLCELWDVNMLRYEFGLDMFLTIEECPEGINLAGTNTSDDENCAIIRNGDVFQIVPWSEEWQARRTRTVSLPSRLVVREYMANNKKVSGGGKGNVPRTVTHDPIKTYNAKVQKHLYDMAKKAIDAGSAMVIDTTEAAGIQTFHKMMLEKMVTALGGSNYVTIV